MGVKLSNNISDISYHFPDDIISESKLSRNLRSLTLDYTFKVNQEYVGRPDLISKLLFNDDNYDWVLLFINGLTKDEIILGTEIKYTSLTNLTKLLVE